MRNRLLEREGRKKHGRERHPSKQQKKKRQKKATDWHRMDFSALPIGTAPRPPAAGERRRSEFGRRHLFRMSSFSFDSLFLLFLFLFGFCLSSVSSLCFPLRATRLTTTGLAALYCPPAFTESTEFYLVYF